MHVFVCVCVCACVSVCACVCVRVCVCLCVSEYVYTLSSRLHLVTSTNMLGYMTESLSLLLYCFVSLLNSGLY